MGLHSKVPFSLFCVLGLVIVGYAQNSPIDFVNVHNAARSQVGVPMPKMAWDETIANFARNYANQRKGDYQLVHSDGRYGENLAMSTSDISGTDAVKLWVNEKANYNYTNMCATGKVCGHYTQVVWKNSVRIRCAKVRCNNGGTFIGCNYDPPGNVIGQKPY